MFHQSEQIEPFTQIKLSLFRIGKCRTAQKNVYLLLAETKSKYPLRFLKDPLTIDNIVALAVKNNTMPRNAIIIIKKPPKETEQKIQFWHFYAK